MPTSVRVSLAAVFLFVAGCAAVPRTTPPDWNDVKLRRQALTHWEIGGRTAVATAQDGWSAGLEWKQKGDVSVVKLSGALGIGGLEVRTDGESLDIKTSKGESLSGDEARATLERQLGLALPLRAMRFWLLGVPQPGKPGLIQLDTDGRLGQLNQEGWTIYFDQYVNEAGNWMPGRVRVEQGTLKVRVLVNRWEL